MAVSEAIRRALKKSKKSQTALGELWNTTPQVINNKIRLERWSGEELAQVAAFTGGQLAMVYPDGEQILILPREAGKPEEKKTEAPKKAKKPAAKRKKPEAAAKPKQKKTPAAKPKERKSPDVIEEQISFFE